MYELVLEQVEGTETSIPVVGVDTQTRLRQIM